MHGTTIPAKALFTLKGADGRVYEIEAPHDPILPPGETVNCRCIIIPVVRRFNK
jgi:uncharacterized protein with gpF-like domain